MNNLKFPLFVDLVGKKVLIYGGGKIATRRALVLLRFGADITVVAPEFAPQLKQNRHLRLQQGVYCPGQMEPACLVLAATDRPDINLAITKEARANGALANNASDHHDCDFYFPAVVQENDICVGISGTGANHAAVKKAAEKIRNMELEK